MSRAATDRMLLRLKKGQNGSDTLTFIRPDGSTTWRHTSPYFIVHDLMHDAVESGLGDRQAVLGLVAGGKDLADFDQGATEWLPEEAIVVEIITGQLQAQLSGSARSDEVGPNIAAACAALGVKAPALSEEDLQQIRARHDALLREWRSLPDGAVLELQWPPAQNE